MRGGIQLSVEAILMIVLGMIFLSLALFYFVPSFIQSGKTQNLEVCRQEIFRVCLLCENVDWKSSFSYEIDKEACPDPTYFSRLGVSSSEYTRHCDSNFKSDCKKLGAPIS